MGKKLLVVLALALMLFGVLSCGTDRRINGKVCETYGIFNKDDVRCPNVRYCTIVGNVVWGILLLKTIVAPVYFFGFSIQEPCADQGAE